jgi:hypothetical protein
MVLKELVRETFVGFAPAKPVTRRDREREELLVTLRKIWTCCTV